MQHPPLVEVQETGTAGAVEPLIEVEALKVHFSMPAERIFSRNREVLKAVDGVSFHIRKGETFGLVGESGSGKTTLGRAILHLHRPTAGRVTFRGTDLAALRPSELRQVRREMQLIFQDPYGSLNPRMTVRRTIAEPLIVHGLTRTRRELGERVAEILATVGLRPEAASRYPHEFSGGQRQRIAIGRALAVNPSFLVCDEPVSALDVSIQAQVMNLLRDLQQRFGLTYLFIAHDISVVRHIAHRIGVMYLGHLVEVAEQDELVKNPLHPYTRALIAAVPIPDPAIEATRPRVPLQGELPSPLHKPHGCVFHSRCPMMIEACKAGMPELREVRPGHWAACIRATEQ